jgi:hypothetical protein
MTHFPAPWSTASHTLSHPPELLRGPAFTLAVERSVRSDARGARLVLVVRIVASSDEGAHEAQQTLATWAFAHRFERIDVQPKRAGFTWLSRRHSGPADASARWFDEAFTKLEGAVRASERSIKRAA